VRLLLTGASGFIGTNAVEDFSRDGADLLNLDVCAPLCGGQKRFWRRVDVLDAPEVGGAFAEFRPTHVLHMAARTDCDENTTVDRGYQVNTAGTRNVIAAINAAGGVRRAVMVSSQYVCGPGHVPQHDEDYAPHTVYGQSKVAMERIVRASGLACVWTIARPANVWGPWHMRYRREFWRVLRRGLYMHPGGGPVVRTYGYVGNVIWQLRRIFEAPREQVDRQTFYLGDMPGDIRAWTDAFSRALRGRPVRTVPRFVLRALGLCGDGVRLLGITPPLTSSRYRSMVQDYLTPMRKTFEVFGTPPFALEDGVRRTVRWLNEYGWPGEAEGREAS